MIAIDEKRCTLLAGKGSFRVLWMVNCPYDLFRKGNVYIEALRILPEEQTLLEF